MSTISNENMKYFFVIKTKNGIWSPIMRPFVLHNNGNSGQFLSSSWYKHAVPDHYECLIIKIRYDTSICENEKIKKYIDILNNTETDITSLPFVVMYNIMNKKYLENVHSRLQDILNSNNEEHSSTRSSIETAFGTFGISFSKKKGSPPVMYCPTFHIT